MEQIDVFDIEDLINDIRTKQLTPKEADALRAVIAAFHPQDEVVAKSPHDPNAPFRTIGEPFFI